VQEPVENPSRQEVTACNPTYCDLFLAKIQIRKPSPMARDLVSHHIAIVRPLLPGDLNELMYVVAKNAHAVIRHVGS
jgi:hypothetical protein